jgi:ubiquinone/menaquinone biosynthesis C-methylase UbiE
MMKHEKNWATFAENFDRLQAYVVGQKTLSLLNEKIETLHGLGDLIEFGCGSGIYTDSLSKVADHVTATDVADDMLQIARQKLEPHSNIRLEQRDCYDSTYPHSSFDTVFMANLIHVVHDPAKALNEAHRILKERGKLVVLSFTADGMTWFNRIGLIYRYLKTFGAPPHKGTPFMLASLTDFVNTHGFSVQDADLIGHNTKAIFLVATKQC